MIIKSLAIAVSLGGLVLGGLAVARIQERPDPDAVAFTSTELPPGVEGGHMVPDPWAKDPQAEMDQFIHEAVDNCMTKVRQLPDPLGLKGYGRFDAYYNSDDGYVMRGSDLAKFKFSKCMDGGYRLAVGER